MVAIFAQKDRLIDTALLSPILFLYFKDITLIYSGIIYYDERLVVTADVYTNFIFAFQI